jgi:hypothetical protein
MTSLAMREGAGTDHDSWIDAPRIGRNGGRHFEKIIYGKTTPYTHIASI